MRRRSSPGIIALAGVCSVLGACGLIVGLEDRTLVADSPVEEGGSDAFSETAADGTAALDDAMSEDAGPCHAPLSPNLIRIARFDPDATASSQFGRGLVSLAGELLIGAGLHDGGSTIYRAVRQADASYTKDGELFRADRIEGIAANDERIVTLHANGRVSVWGRDGSFQTEFAHDAGADFIPLRSPIVIRGDVILTSATVLTDAGPAPHAVVYRRSDAGAWTKEAVLLRDEDAGAWTFGVAIALADDWAFVSTPTQGSGDVAAYRRTNGTWSLHSFIVAPQATIEAGSPMRPLAFGSSLLVHDGELLVGSPGASRLDTFAWDGTGWSYRASATFTNEENLGDGIAALGSAVVLVGHATNTYARVLCREGSGWSQIGSTLTFEGSYSGTGYELGFGAGSGRLLFHREFFEFFGKTESEVVVFE